MDETSQLLSGFFYPRDAALLDVTEDAGGAHRIGQLGPFVIGDIHYGARVRLRFTDARPSYQANLLLTGCHLSRHRDLRRTLRPDSAALYGPEGELEIISPATDTRHLSVKIDQDATAIALTGSARLVTEFLLGLDRADPVSARELVPHALGLVDTALGWAAGRSTGDGSELALTRERVHRAVRANAPDPGLDADQVAAACRVSRRTLFRALADDEPFTALVRRVRVERAQQLLLAQRNRTVAAIAHECGFAGPAQLHRAFQRVTGTTPAGYRAVNPALTRATNWPGAGGVGPVTNRPSDTS